MIQQLPKWILWGGGILAFSAGCLNTTALMGFTHLSVSHVTGNVSLFAAAMAHADIPSILFIGAALLSFLAGSIISGFVIGQTKLELGRRYGVALYLEALLIIVAWYLFAHDNHYGQMVAAAACGLQNSMIATYSGAVIRTTHLTGLTSDLGAAIGNWLAGRKVNKLMVFFQAMIWYCFCGGGLAGAFFYEKYGYHTLIIPITIIIVAATIYHKLPQKTA